MKTGFAVLVALLVNCTLAPSMHRGGVRKRLIQQPAENETAEDADTRSGGLRKRLKDDAAPTNTSNGVETTGRACLAPF